MRIGIDCRMWNETGIGRYIRNIVFELSKLDKTNNYILFFLPEDMKKVDMPENFAKVSAPYRWHTFSEQIFLPFLYYKYKLNLLYVPHFNVPLLYFGKFICTIHDLTLLRTRTNRASTLPVPFYYIKHLAFKLNVLFTVVRAHKIFSVSKFVKEDIVSTFKIKASRVLLTPCAVTSDFHKIMLGDILPIFQKYNVEQPYIFYVGNAHPHKNIERLIRAFEIVSKKFPELTLVLGGGKKFFYERIEKEISSRQISGKIIFTGFIDDADLPALYSGAEAFINPSMYEGFGIQILEAYACGAKVICSNTTSLPEVAGEGAYYFDPLNVENMSEVIISALKDTSSDKVDFGYKRVEEFSWKKSAQTILAVYENRHSM